MFQLVEKSFNSVYGKDVKDLKKLLYPYDCSMREHPKCQIITADQMSQVSQILLIRKMSLCFMISYPVHVQLSWNSCRIPDQLWRHRLTWFHRRGRGLNVGNFHTTTELITRGPIIRRQRHLRHLLIWMNIGRRSDTFEIFWSVVRVNPDKCEPHQTWSGANHFVCGGFLVGQKYHLVWCMCVSWTIPRNTTKSVIYHFSCSLVQDTFTSSRQYGGVVLWLLQFRCT